jgi:hypothetical protein
MRRAEVNQAEGPILPKAISLPSQKNCCMFGGLTD